MFVINLNIPTDYHYCVQGWTNPASGSFKAGVVESGKGIDGYNAASPTGGSLLSDTVFEGKDKDGNKAQFRIHLSAAPGQETLFVIKQVLVASKV